MKMGTGEHTFTRPLDNLARAMFPVPIDYNKVDDEDSGSLAW